jgi:hypothetical protein
MQIRGSVVWNERAFLLTACGRVKDSVSRHSCSLAGVWLIQIWLQPQSWFWSTHVLLIGVRATDYLVHPFHYDWMQLPKKVIGHMEWYFNFRLGYVTSSHLPLGKQVICLKTIITGQNCSILTKESIYLLNNRSTYNIHLFFYSLFLNL